jgi:MFS family permease
MKSKHLIPSLFSGIFLGFLCAFLVRGNWRVLLATAIIPAIVLLFLVSICTESPRFLIQKHRYADAYKSLLQLRGTEIQAARDLYNIHSQLQVEATRRWRPNESQWSEKFELYIYQRWIREENFFSRMWYLFTAPRNRRACMVALIVMLSQQLCGVSYYTKLYRNLACLFWLLTLYVPLTDKCSGILFISSYRS